MAEAVRRFLLQCVCMIILLLGSVAAHAHLISSNKASINLKPDGAYWVMSLPIQHFPNIDDDHDGLLSDVELRRHENQIQLQLREQAWLSAQGKRLPLEFAWMTLSLAEHAPRADQILFFLRVPWTSPPPALRIHFHLFQQGITESLSVDVINELGTNSSHGDNASSSNERKRTRFWLTADVSESSLHPTWIEVAGQFYKLGFIHIAEGIDHLLFIVITLLIQVKVRRWLILLSSFTLAHACTYTLLALQLIQKPPIWVESAIAATLFLSALCLVLNWKPKISLETLIVFLFGFIHGLGFAAAMGSTTTHPQFVWTSLIWFNLGIESAQLIIALGVGIALKLTLPNMLLARYQTLLGVIACMISLGWLYQRWGM